MTSNIVLEERRLVEKIANDYDKRGYDLIFDPTNGHLPPELSGFRPDLLAISPSETIVVEVKSQGKVRRLDYWKNLQESIAKIPGWHLRLVTNGASMEESITVEETKQTLEQGQDLAEKDALVPALLMGWSGAEAAMRAALTFNHVNVPDYSPSTLISQLYTEGLLDDDAYQVLRESVRKRNAVAHGFRQEVSRGDVDRLLAVARDLLPA